MEKLKQKHDTLINALKTLDEAITLLKEKHPEKFHQSLQDSLVKRFEYTFELLWKFIKLYLQEFERMPATLASPRGILREASKVGLINNQEYKELLKALEERNLSSHIYNEKVIEEIVSAIPKTYQTMHDITHRIKL